MSNKTPEQIAEEIAQQHEDMFGRAVARDAARAAVEPHRASDYALSEDDWKAGLSDDEAAEIVRLLEWQEARA